jgi:hypothetical protein
MTAFRLIERARHKKLGADDALAAFAMCAVILIMIVLELHVEPQTVNLPRVYSTGMMNDANQTNAIWQTTLIGLYYIMAQSFYAVIWYERVSAPSSFTHCMMIIRTCRLSIIASLRRIIITGTMNKILMYGMYALLIPWGILFAQLFWTCENEPEWKDTPAPFCALGQKVAVTQVISESPPPSSFVSC